MGLQTYYLSILGVAIVLTACGIETPHAIKSLRFAFRVAIVLTACGIETGPTQGICKHDSFTVATVLTACGIETSSINYSSFCLFRLQQYLPLAVLKQLVSVVSYATWVRQLQQYLPLAVLKLKYRRLFFSFTVFVATVLTACGIETNL